MNKLNKLIAVLLLVSLLILAACTKATNTGVDNTLTKDNTAENTVAEDIATESTGVQTKVAENIGNGMEMTVYKSQSCGCCSSYIEELKENGFSVKVESVSDVSPIKDKFNIPLDKRSCHTAIIGDYFVEGHVPMEALKKLLTEKPDVDGIGLPEMQSGSPGMPGIKTDDFEVYALKDGEVSEFVKI